LDDFSLKRLWWRGLSRLRGRSRFGEVKAQAIDVFGFDAGKPVTRCLGVMPFPNEKTAKRPV